METKIKKNIEEAKELIIEHKSEIVSALLSTIIGITIGVGICEHEFKKCIGDVVILNFQRNSCSPLNNK